MDFYCRLTCVELTLELQEKLVKFSSLFVSAFIYQPIDRYSIVIVDIVADLNNIDIPNHVICCDNSAVFVFVHYFIHSVSSLCVCRSPSIIVGSAVWFYCQITPEV